MKIGRSPRTYAASAMATKTPSSQPHYHTHTPPSAMTAQTRHIRVKQEHKRRPGNFGAPSRPPIASKALPLDRVVGARGNDAVSHTRVEEPAQQPIAREEESEVLDPRKLEQLRDRWTVKDVSRGNRYRQLRLEAVGRSRRPEWRVRDQTDGVVARSVPSEHVVRCLGEPVLADGLLQ
eukprot:scaffold10560_cov133-Isochrysis_galbana.AAC.24